MYLPTTTTTTAHEFTAALSRLLGWLYVLCWGISFYPQPLINARRKSVTGLAPDFFTVNILGFAAYAVSALLFLVSDVVRGQYGERHPGSPEPTVRWNDFAFAAHATLISIVTWSQFYFWGYRRDASQRVSGTMRGIIAACFFAIAVAIIRVPLDSTWEWIDVVYTLQYIKIAISVIKYVPQAYLNYTRKATTGWSIENILLDFSGGVLSLSQLVLDSSLQNDWSGLAGNPVKFFLGQISILFDIVFITQHYILYRQPRPRAVAARGAGGAQAVYGAVGGRASGTVAEEERRRFGRRVSRGEEGEEVQGDAERRALLSRALGETAVVGGGIDGA